MSRGFFLNFKSEDRRVLIVVAKIIWNAALHFFRTNIENFTRVCTLLILFYNISCEAVFCFIILQRQLSSLLSA